MPNNFRRFRAGEPWIVSQTTANAIIESAENWASHRGDPGDATPPEYLFDGTTILVRNDSGVTQNRFSVMGIGNPIITDTQNLQDFQNYPRFSVVVPVAPDNVGKFCVLLEPLPVNAIGKAIV